MSECVLCVPVKYFKCANIESVNCVYNRSEGAWKMRICWNHRNYMTLINVQSIYWFQCGVRAGFFANISRKPEGMPCENQRECLFQAFYCRCVQIIAHIAYYLDVILGLNICFAFPYREGHRQRNRLHKTPCDRKYCTKILYRLKTSKPIPSFSTSIWADSLILP